MSYLSERMYLRRPLAALVLGLGTWLLALCCALSFNQWQDVHFVADLTLFELLDVLTVGIMLPVVALLTALLVGYAMHREILRVELYREGNYFFICWRICLRYIAPPAILIILVAAVVDYL